MTISAPDPPPPPAFDLAVLQPGDKVMLVTERDLDAAELHRIRDTLVGNFPGVNFVVVSGFVAAIARGEQE